MVFVVVASMLAALPARADDVGAAINAARGSALPIDGTVDAFAQAAAQRIASSQSLVHSNLSSLLGPCTTAGEVIGYGPDIGSVMKAFAASPGHWSTINQSKWNAMGTGLAVDSAGVVWVAVVFCTLGSAPAPPPPPPPPPPPAPTPAPTPAQTSPPPTASSSSPTPPAPPSVPIVAMIREYGPFLTADRTVSVLLGASPFLPEEDWRNFEIPVIN